MAGAAFEEGEDVFWFDVFVGDPVVFKVECEGGLEGGPEKLHGLSESGLSGFVDFGLGEELDDDLLAFGVVLFVSAEGIEINAEVGDLEELEEVSLKRDESSFEEVGSATRDQGDVDGLLHF